jgi:hypothetical protein
MDPFSGCCQVKVNIVWPLAPAATAGTSGSNNGGSSAAAFPDTVRPSGACSLLLPEAAEEAQLVAEHAQLAPRRCQSLWTVVNPLDRWCMVRSVFLGLVYHWLLPVPAEFMAARGPRGGGAADRLASAPHVPSHFLERQELHKVYILQIMAEAGINLDLQFYGLQEEGLLQQWMVGRFGQGRVRLIIMSYEHQYRMVYRGVDHPTEVNLCLYLQQQHYCFIGRPELLFNVCLCSCYIFKIFI